MNNIFSQVLKGDLFSKPVAINIAGQDSSRSYLGVLVSIACLTLAIYMTAPTIKKFVKESDPTINSYYEYDTDKLNMTYDNFFFSVGFFSQLDGKSKEISNTTNNYTALLNIDNINIDCPNCNFTINSTYYDGIYNSIKKGNSTRRLQDASNVNQIEKRNDIRNLATNSTTTWSKSYAYLSSQLIPKYSKSNITSSNFSLMYCRTKRFDGIRIKSMAKKRAYDISSIMKTFSYCLPPMFNGVISDGSTSSSDSSMKFQMSYQTTTKIPTTLTTVFKETGAVNPSTGEEPDSVYDMEDDYFDKEDYYEDDLEKEDQYEAEEDKYYDYEDDIKYTEEDDDEDTTDNTDTADIADTTTDQNNKQSTKSTQESEALNDNENIRLLISNNTYVSSEYRKNTYNNTISIGNSNSEYVNYKANRELQSGTQYITNSTLQSSLKMIHEKNQFPKILLLTKNLQITPQGKTLLTILYEMNILDYYDQLSGIPIDYNIYVQNITVIVTKTKFIIPRQKKTTVLIVNKIERNTLDTSDRTSIGFNFKVYSDTKIITVVYTSFENVLEVFGSFFAVFSLFATITSELYNDIFYKKAMVNELFTFVHYKNGLNIGKGRFLSGNSGNNGVIDNNSNPNNYNNGENNGNDVIINYNNLNSINNNIELKNGNNLDDFRSNSNLYNIKRNNMHVGNIKISSKDSKDSKDNNYLSDISKFHKVSFIKTNNNIRNACENQIDLNKLNSLSKINEIISNQIMKDTNNASNSNNKMKSNINNISIFNIDNENDDFSNFNQANNMIAVLKPTGYPLSSHSKNSKDRDNDSYKNNDNRNKDGSSNTDRNLIKNNYLNKQEDVITLNNESSKINSKIISPKMRNNQDVKYSNEDFKVFDDNKYNYNNNNSNELNINKINEKDSNSGLKYNSLDRVKNIQKTTKEGSDYSNYKKEIHEIIDCGLSIKKKDEIKIDLVNIWEVVQSTIICFCLKPNRKIKLIDKAYDLIENKMEVSNIIKNQLDVFFLKRLLLSKEALTQFHDNYREINYDEENVAHEYLDLLEESVKEGQY